jgi:monovalent cation:H+ antiporter-2, CPA2 family
MSQHTSLIATIVAGLGLAFVFGAAAHRLRLSPLVGYLLAGVLIGPFTPGYVADQSLAPQLAEIGVILLMFGVGLHFSLSDLLAVRWISAPGALGQILLVGGLGYILGSFLGLPVGGAFVFGLSLSVASTVVVLRALQDRRLMDTERGKVAIGWLVVQDLAMVLALVLVPALSGVLGGRPTAPAPAAVAGLESWLEPSTVWGALSLTLLKVAAFVAVMLIGGRRIIPGILHWVAHTGSRELFRLAVLAIALGVAYGSAELFGVSFALGAFFAGMILAESTLSQQAANETLPLRDAFAVLFFVSVGMLFDPGILARQPMAVAAAFLVVVLGNGIVAFAICRLLGRSLRTALTLGASMAQIGEFSFILSGLGSDLGLIPVEDRSLILAAALLSIIANPLIFVAVDHFVRAHVEPVKDRPSSGTGPKHSVETMPVELATSALEGHAVLVGFGRVGSILGEDLIAKGVPLLVVEDRREVVEGLRDRGIEAVSGNAAQPGLLEAANISKALWLVSAIPNPFESANLIEHGRAANPNLHIIARAHSKAEVEYLRKFGANLIVMGEEEIARRILEYLDLKQDSSRSTSATEDRRLPEH